MAKRLPWRTSINFGGFKRVFWDGKQSGKDQNRKYAGRGPDFGKNYREHRQFLIHEPRDRRRCHTKRLQGIIHQTDVVIENKLELKTNENGREHHWKHHHGTQSTLTPGHTADQ